VKAGPVADVPPRLHCLDDRRAAFLRTVWLQEQPVARLQLRRLLQVGVGELSHPHGVRA
jgi:hypothetical protein